MNNKVIDAALGVQPADTVVLNGQFVNVLSREVYQADVAIVDGLVAMVGKLEPGSIGPNTVKIDAAGKYIVPGFIDAHIHVESSMLTYTEFSKMAVSRGTTAVASDLMEITIVSGIEGMKEVLRESKSSPVKLFYTVPSFMEDESEMQTIGAVLNSEMIEQSLNLPESVGLAEVLYPPILNKSEKSSHVLELAKQRHKTAEGHAPKLFGSQLAAYASTGINSDHESSDAEEALGKLRSGIRVLMREGSASTDLEACLEIITKYNVDTRRCSMVSDDIDMLHIHRKGHMDNKVRMAVKSGVDPIVALQMVTINPAESLKLDDRIGSVSPGKCADIVILDSLTECSVNKVISDGKLMFDDGKVIADIKSPEISDLLKNTVKLIREVTSDDFNVRVDHSASTAQVHVIGASPVSLITEPLTAELQVENGSVKPDSSKDILMIASVERYGKNGSIGRAFVKGFGLGSATIATSVGHDHHNITVVGSNSADMALAVNRIAELQGGILMVENGKVLHEIALPICGLLSSQDGVAMALELEAMQKDLAKRGCTMSSPFMTLSFVTLIFIPTLRITDRGLVDVMNFKVIPSVIETK